MYNNISLELINLRQCKSCMISSLNIVQTPDASIPKLTLLPGNGLQCFMDGRSLPAPCPASSKQSLCGIRKDREGGPLFYFKSFVPLWMEKAKTAIKQCIAMSLES